MSQTIFKATYSGVPVYEMPVKNVAVMRRRADAWMNATQLLKVAGFDKPQRTRVLERDVQKGVHEKVQGGYGKYQGTWIPIERALALAQQFGCDHLLQPMFDYQPSAESPPLAPKHVVAAPNRVKKARDQSESPMSMPTQRQTAPRRAAAAAMQTFNDIDADGESDPDEFSLERPTNGQVMDRSMSDSQYGESSSHTPSPLHSPTAHLRSIDGYSQQVPPRTAYPPPPVPGAGSHRYASLILDYFVSDSLTIPPFLLDPPSDFDPNVIIDDDGHTALHWACAMGRIKIVRLLLTAGADIFRANTEGQTALMRSVMFTNNYDLRKFPELFDLLCRSTINIDRQDRSVFHYIVDIALNKGKTNAARYYLEAALERLREYPQELADILNFQDADGETALTLAARARNKRLVKILYDFGSDGKIRNKEGKSAEDYIIEDERFRNGSSSTSSIGALAPRPPRSDIGQKIHVQLVPQVAELLQRLAAAYDEELEGKTRDMNHAQQLLGEIQAEVVQSQRALAILQEQSAILPDLQQRQSALQAELESKIAARLRQGWEYYRRGEDDRDTEAAQGQPVTRAYDEPDSTPNSGDLQQQVTELQSTVKTLVKTFVADAAEKGASARMADYRKVIALACGLAPDKVDELVPVLVEDMAQEWLVDDPSVMVS